jgi:hypothetical protein
MVSSTKSRTPTASRRVRPGAQRRTRTRIEATVFMALRPLTRGELARVTRALLIEGLSDLKPARVLLSRADAKRMATGRGGPVKAKLTSSTNLAPNEAEPTPQATLQRALQDARARGTALKERLLADPEMLSTAEMANRLGMSEEGIRLKRKRHELLGLEFAKRGIRYPSWQVIEDRQLVQDLPRVFAVLGDDPWRIYRFLVQQHPELGGRRAIDELKRGRIENVLAAAQNTGTGAFS